MKEVKVKIVNKSEFPLPEYKTIGSAGCDLYANIDEPITLEMGKIELIPTGLFISLPKGYEAQIRARSGLAAKHGISLVNGVGTIDCDYTGEIKVVITNLKEIPYTVKKGDRIAQMVINEVIRADFELVEELEETKRNSGGFGSTGI